MSRDNPNAGHVTFKRQTTEAQTDLVQDATAASDASAICCHCRTRAISPPRMKEIPCARTLRFSSDADWRAAATSCGVHRMPA